jgi:hypothetical protein
VVWIEGKMTIANDGWDGLKRGEERCAGLDRSRIDRDEGEFADATNRFVCQKAGLETTCD